MEKSRVLFLCTGNSARSQMAEALLRKYAGDHFEAHSAGLEPKALNPLTIKVMEEAGFDMSGHRSKGVGEYLGKVHFQYLITVCDDAERTVQPSGRVSTSACTGPLKTRRDLKDRQQKLAKFRQVRDLIEAKVRPGWPNRTSRLLRKEKFPTKRPVIYTGLLICHVLFMAELVSFWEHIRMSMNSPG